MFSGVVTDLGQVLGLERSEDGLRLTVGTSLAPELAPGDSIAVNGVCLTAAQVDGGSFGADVMAETRRRSSLGSLSAEAWVNLELALRLSDRLGGHMVQGHVDGVGVVEDLRSDGFATVLTLAAEPELLRYVVARGSIAVEGVSLTVVAADDRGLQVSLIPETQARTTLGRLVPGAAVNLEVDVLAKYVEKLVGRARATSEGEAAPA